MHAWPMHRSYRCCSRSIMPRIDATSYANTQWPPIAAWSTDIEYGVLRTTMSGKKFEPREFRLHSCSASGTVRQRRNPPAPHNIKHFIRPAVDRVFIPQGGNDYSTQGDNTSPVSSGGIHPSSWLKGDDYSVLRPQHSVYTHLIEWSQF